MPYMLTLVLVLACSGAAGCGAECERSRSLPIDIPEDAFVSEVSSDREAVYAHLFQTLTDVASGTPEIYGFVVSEPDPGTRQPTLESLLDGCGLTISSSSSASTANTQVLEAQQRTGLFGLRNCFFDRAHGPGWGEAATPATDPYYGNTICPGSSRCYSQFVVLAKREYSRGLANTLFAITQADADAQRREQSVGALERLGEQALTVGSRCSEN